MFGGNGSNTVFPVFLDNNGIQYASNASIQLQLFENGTGGCNIDPLNFLGIEQNSSAFRPNKRGREAEANLRQQKLQISLNHNICLDESDIPANIPHQNPVSTGLRLAYDDEERNSSITSASGSMTIAPSIMLSFGDVIATELDRQKEEFDRFIKTQEEIMVNGVRDIQQRHMASFLTAIEKGISKKLREKDVEIEAINRKNTELVEKIKQVASEAQTWHYRAKYNESVVNILRTDLQRALAQGVNQVKEGFGDSDLDDAASCIDPINYSAIPNGTGKSYLGKDNLTCRSCKAKEVSVLLMPCRHLCLCRDCEGFVNVCPVCQMAKTASVQVYLS